jgi:hypothetical protein
MKIVNPDKYSINDCQGKENEVLYNLTWFLLNDYFIVK